MARARADKGQTRALACLGEVTILGEEAVAGMDRVGTEGGCSAQNRRDVEVAVFGGRRADTDRFIGHSYVECVFVGGGIDRDRRNTELAASADNTNCNRSPISDEQLLEHPSAPGQATSKIISGCPYSTGCALAAMIRTTRPATGASISFIIFIASMIHSGWPLRIEVPSSTKGAASGDAAR